mmetsp:Transcript_19926/g.35409  ORF Transcript_19926/g.35409 Transcript_19926/m.35409 type:complete len:127 (+) Transcript_19926:1086-1466(+)
MSRFLVQTTYDSSTQRNASSNHKQPRAIRNPTGEFQPTQKPCHAANTQHTTENGTSYCVLQPPMLHTAILNATPNLPEPTDIFLTLPLSFSPSDPSELHRALPSTKEAQRVPPNIREPQRACLRPL